MVCLIPQGDLVYNASFAGMSLKISNQNQMTQNSPTPSSVTIRAFLSLPSFTITNNSVNKVFFEKSRILTKTVGGC